MTVRKKQLCILNSHGLGTLRCGGWMGRRLQLFDSPRSSPSAPKDSVTLFKCVILWVCALLCFCHRVWIATQPFVTVHRSAHSSGIVIPPIPKKCKMSFSSIRASPCTRKEPKNEQTHNARADQKSPPKGMSSKSRSSSAASRFPH